MNRNYDFKFYVAMLGAQNVGKTSIIEQFVQNKGYSERYTKTIELDGTKVHLTVVLSNGKEGNSVQ